MEFNQTAKLFIDFQKTAFTNWCNAMALFQDQFERFVNSAIDHADWRPDGFNCFLGRISLPGEKTLAFTSETEDQPRSILIVEDYELLLNLLSEAFAMPGWQVFKANDGLSGWDQFQRKPVDIVLTDIQMPGLSGIELAHRIRKQSPETIIALMSGENDGVARKLIENGTIDFFYPKPFSLSQVSKSLTATVKGS